MQAVIDDTREKRPQTVRIDHRRRAWSAIVRVRGDRKRLGPLGEKAPGAFSDNTNARDAQPFAGGIGPMDIFERLFETSGHVLQQITASHLAMLHFGSDVVTCWR